MPCLNLQCRVTRYCNEDCVLNGVHFKKGALIFLVIDTIHHDPKVWPDPEVFNLDRKLQVFITIVFVFTS